MLICNVALQWKFKRKTEKGNESKENDNIQQELLNGVQSYISVYLYKSPLKIEENARLSDPCHNRRENFHLAEIDPRMRRRKRSRENLEVGKENRGDIYLEAARVVYGQPSLDYNFKSTTS